jgi:hypothetical protein
MLPAGLVLSRPGSNDGQRSNVVKIKYEMQYFNLLILEDKKKKS